MLNPKKTMDEFAALDKLHREVVRERNALAAEVEQKAKRIERLEESVKYLRSRHLIHADYCEAILNETAAEAQKRCSITGNLCGTDTWKAGDPPDCDCGRKQRAADKQCEHGVEEGTPCMKCIQYWNPADKEPCVHPPESVSRDTGFCSSCCTFPADKGQS